MIFLAIIVIFSFIAAFVPPQYCIPVAAIPFLIPIYILIKEHKWYESLLYLIGIPLLAIIMF